MVLIGVISALGAQNIGLDTDAFTKKMFAIKMREHLTQLRNRAINTGCDMHVAITANTSYSFTHKDIDNGVECSASTFVPMTINGKSSFATNGLTLSSTYNDFFFNYDGRPARGTSLIGDTTITLGGDINLIIVGQTGYIYLQ